MPKVGLGLLVLGTGYVIYNLTKGAP